MSTVHHVVVGLGGKGFRAICSCGWRSGLSWERAVVAQEGAEHKHATRLQEVR